MKGRYYITIKYDKDKILKYIPYYPKYIYNHNNKKYEIRELINTFQFIYQNKECHLSFHHGELLTLHGDDLEVLKELSILISVEL